MEFSGTVEIDAPRTAVWDLLLDFEQLATCGPGVQSVEWLDATHARVKAKIGVGFMTMGFTIELELVEVVVVDVMAAHRAGIEEAVAARKEAERLHGFHANHGRAA